ncbi:D-alanyl-D-alanine carboxypeptidase family protein [Thermithiobacillus plumbiphilus]|uniref:serine-type D-Ala-D-Ala carboxypeptidase n=1 Tax=Thermithiobacillus plumbiphilus TaxID=1729899 RepID=A0ABU9DAF7_9PROT
MRSRDALFAVLYQFRLLILMLFLAPGLAQAVPSPVLPIPAAPDIGARSYLLMDYVSGQIIASRAPNERMEPASLTKLMSDYVVFNELKKGRLKLDEYVTVSTHAWRTGGSRMFIEPNKPVKVVDLIQGMNVVSGNDATVALAERIAGSESAFADLMNAYARMLGMRNTHFTNPTGLPDPNHYTTAYDLSLLARAIIRDFPQYYRWYSQKSFTYNNITQPNRNLLLDWDPTVDGMKTGFTDKAQYCLVATAKRTDMRLISVVLGTDSPKARAQQAQSLLNYGFRFYESRKLYSANQPVTKVKVWKGSSDEVKIGAAHDYYVLVPRGRGQISASVQLNPQVIAPVKKHQQLGTIIVRNGDKVLARIPAVAMHGVSEGGLIARTIDTVRLRFQ